MTSNSDHLTAAVEQKTIGALLQQPELLLDLDLMPEDFQQAGLRSAYQAVQAVQAASQPVDVITVASRLERDSGGKDYLPLLVAAVQECVAPANGQLYAQQVRKRANIRRARDIAGTLMDAASDGTAAIDQAIAALMDLTRDRQSHECGIADALRDTLNHVETLFQRGDKIAGITSGLADLDRITGGFQDGDLYVIGARPAMGKTALLINMAMAAGVPVGIISAEQPRLQIGGRMISIEGRISATRLRNGRLHNSEWPELTGAVASLHEHQIRIFDKPAPTINDVARQARAWQHHHGIKCLYLDYLQRIGGLDRKAPRYERVGQVVMGLKELARELSIPIIALAQINRAVEARQDRRPGMADLKDSGEIEQEADDIITLYRDEVYNADTADKGIAEIEILKNRHGPTGFCRVAWQAQWMRFADLAA